MEHVHKTYPSSPIVSAGFSMGANILINYLGEYHGKDKTLTSDTIPLLGAVSVCQSYDLLATCNFIPANRPLYNYGLNLKMVSLVKNHQKLFQTVDGIDISLLLKTKSLKEFDENFTCKIHNFESAESYYKSQCCSKHLHNINVPTLLVNSLDDPIIPEFHLEPVKKVCKANNKLMLATTTFGGHLGFAEGFFFSKTNLDGSNHPGIFYCSFALGNF